MSKRLDQYIEIVEVPNEGKRTKIWNIINKQTQEIVGLVKWYGGWRKYVYHHNDNGYSDWDFLRLIADFCETKTKEHYHL